LLYDLLKTDMFKGVSVDGILNIVRHDNFKRFEVGRDTRQNGYGLQIRHTQSNHVK
jgi:hypothetical protein